MKYSLLVLAAHLSAANFARAQEELASEITSPATTPTTARILGDIPDGSPSPPEAPKPEYQVAKSDILQSISHEQGGRTITIQRIKPIPLPPPPQADTAQTEEFFRRIADFQEANSRSGLLFLGATVFRSKDQPPRTWVRMWPEGGGPAIDLWSSADFALIAGGINSFEDASGNDHHLFMSWSHVDVDRLSEIFESKNGGYAPPPIPEFPKGGASFQVVGKQPAAEHLTAIQSLHDLYSRERVKLQSAYEGRERARLQREAELKANPPKPRNLTLNYWRVEKPASNGEGAAR